MLYPISDDISSSIKIYRLIDHSTSPSRHHRPPRMTSACRWDHWIEDFLLCNGLGLWAGMATVRLLNIKTFDWTGA